ncbi:trimethylguanosine synthase [Plectosphaerella cucumerina]|uniref:Trimethylguanosine synthase n=1 Tax=Plectosphaerella cucumerina TaxID=40658 RepID=A0A8K0TCE7_9PEZI|nr:trimethylguanosine synthase [Plectosphaerella cucumerina]
MSGTAADEVVMRPAPTLPLTDECHHYSTVSEVPWDLQKYFQQRYSIFQYYDDGVYLTDDAWFGVTPEPVASQVAYDMAGSKSEKKVLIDLFGGAGGNTIAFALSERWEKIISIEKHGPTLACAQSNASLYEVGEYITWIHGDCFEYLDRLLNNPASLDEALRVNPDTTVVFASPPWGGPGYRDAEVFDLRHMEPYNLQQLSDACGPMDHALYLPRTSDLRQLARLAPPEEQIEVVQYCMKGASKALVAFIPGNKNSVDS